MSRELTRRSRSSNLIIDALRRGKASGQRVTNMDLSSISLRFGARIHELRKLGYKILTKAGKGGLFMYELKAEPKR